MRKNLSDKNKIKIPALLLLFTPSIITGIIDLCIQYFILSHYSGIKLINNAMTMTAICIIVFFFMGVFVGKVIERNG